MALSAPKENRDIPPLRPTRIVHTDESCDFPQLHLVEINRRHQREIEKRRLGEGAGDLDAETWNGVDDRKSGGL